MRDITNPDDVFNKDRAVGGGETERPAASFARLEEGLHFPRGWIYYRLPSGTEARVATTGPSAIREALTLADTRPGHWWIHTGQGGPAWSPSSAGGRSQPAP